MSAPPAQKSRESTKISMVVEEWKEGQTEQFSTVHRIKGYPWRLRLIKENRTARDLELLCDKSNEADLWMCKATIKALFNATITPVTVSFNSWNEYAQRTPIGVFGSVEGHPNRINLDPSWIKTAGRVVEVEIELDTDGEKWNHPTLDPLEPLDGILVIGEKKIDVHKPSLAAQSSFFNNLFFGNFKEKDMAEITIEDVDYEEFINLIKIIYRLDGIDLTDENVFNVLHLAGRFDFKIVESVCTNYLLSKSSLSIHQKLILSEENNLPLLKENIIARYTDCHLKVLVDSPEWEVLSKDTIKVLMKKCLGMDTMDRSSESDMTYRRR